MKKFYAKVRLVSGPLLLLSFVLSNIVFAQVSAPGNDPWLRFPALSPDGKTIAFCYQGNLFTVPAEGGNAQVLTLHEAYDFRPVWSPDSKTIAFASARYGNFDIYTIPATGGTETRLTFHSADEIPSTFTPDGQFIVFGSAQLDTKDNILFPNGAQPELYKIPSKGGRTQQVLTSPAEEVQFDPSGTKMYYQDLKGYEDELRKHHTSSISRDIWLYDVAKGTHKKITTFEGEDRNPVVSPDGTELYYVSEESGSFNVYKISVNDALRKTQLTKHSKHPVRHLSISKKGMLCYSIHGEVYLLNPADGISKKVTINLNTPGTSNDIRNDVLRTGATEATVSPNGKEVAFVVRGDIFVSAVENGKTKRITSTPTQERSISFSPDGRKILYAGERNGSWNIYETSLGRKEESYFYLSTILKDTILVQTPADEFQPYYSPDGKEVAYLEERVKLKVLNLASGKTRYITNGEKNYSYSDGDQWYQWSPDSKWFLVTFNDRGRWMDEVGLVSATGAEPIVNLTNSGYADYIPKWMNKGKMAIWFSDKNGERSHGSWGGENDVYAMFFTKDAWDKYKLPKDEYDILVEQEKKKKEEEAKKDSSKTKNESITKDKNKSKASVDSSATASVKSDTAKTDSVIIDLDHLKDRMARLTIHSSDLADAVLSPDGEKLYYLSSFEKGHDLWVTNLRDKETKVLLKLEERGGGLEFDKEGKNLFVFSGGKVIRINTENNERKDVSYAANVTLNLPAERAYLFDHVCEQVKKKFYVSDLHKVDWEYYKKEYKKLLGSINNNYDFSDLLSELLGELNASHTGSGYRFTAPNRDATAALGLFYDYSFTGNGLKVEEVIEKGPFDIAASNLKAGMIIEKLDGVEITIEMNQYVLFNQKAGKPMLVSIFDPETGKRFEETVKPIPWGEQNELCYQRWVSSRQKETEKLSGGKLGYVHVRGMNDDSFRETYSEVLGKYADKEGIIVDTRFNGGGWLHDDLASLLSGKRYVDLVPREQKIGSEPLNKWYRKSAILVGESNYSDAHFFPYVYRALNIGPIIGMPVPGTATAVWWETLMDQSLYFGIPQVGVVGLDGRYLENQELVPDYQVKNTYDQAAKGRDEQLEKAVDVLLKK